MTAQRSNDCIRVSVSVLWDDQASVYVATSEDVPGLAIEAASLDRLVQKLRVIVPELLEENANG